MMKEYETLISGVLFILQYCRTINPLNAELNPICHMLALLAHHIFHVSRLRVNGNFYNSLASASCAQAQPAQP